MASRGKLKVAALKKATLGEARLCGIPIKYDESIVGHLIPVGAWILEDSGLIELISEWRARARLMFLAQFESTPEKTERYLRERSIADDSRILFMIEVSGEFLGHVGLANINQTSAELDNLMRGVSGGIPELLEASERALVAWAFKKLDLDMLYLRVLSYNWMAKSIHEQIGFLTGERLPLRQEILPDGRVLVQCGTGEATVPYTCDVMELERKEFVDS